MPAFAIVVVVFLAAFAAGCGSDADQSTASRYVALGDSNASGAGLPTPATGAPKNCYRTESGYPAFAAEQLKLDEFQSVACSGAGVNALDDEMALYPDGVAPPQFDALKGHETIVSVTVGVNDAGLGVAAETCLKAKSPSDTPCQDKYVTGGENKLTAAALAIVEPLGEKLDAIHAQSPKAKIFLVGYAPIIPADGAGCWGKINVSPLDAPYFYGFQRAISDSEKAAAEAHGATYVDLFAAGEGHDACQPPGRRWSNPVNRVGAAGWPLHPTLSGSRAAAALLVRSARSSRLDQ
ncbi:MAG: SGNH/GDSL hydrolase family protein [Thermoleophilaceae bacterium]|nr:SGNH/GDSL hydrolase family protein [Thermoleophilaceae bacterium]